ncbi:MAG: recombination protein O N-terminal domain-containing protein [Bacteroidales bacterium]|nr:recombination protein O N-terminal domain-containing protein [Bacteroidales bacterium]
MLLKTKAVFFKQVKFSDTKRMVTFYTEEIGTVSVVMRYDKKLKNFIPLSPVELVIDYHENKPVHYIKEYTFQPPLYNISGNPLKASVVIFLNEVLYNAIKEHEKNKALFNFIHENIIAFDRTAMPQFDFHIYFMIGLTRFLGCYPENNFNVKNCIFDLREGKFVIHADHQDTITGNEAEIFSICIANEQTKRYQSIVKRVFRIALLHHLCFYYRIHLEGFHMPNSLRVLEEVMQ